MAPSRSIPARLRRHVAERARFLCEYCQLQQALCSEELEIDHIKPRSAGGRTISKNLCQACWRCNNAKSNHTKATDLVSGTRVRLFNPRVDRWHRHFRWSDDFGTIIGQTRIGRATTVALDMNHPRLVQIRLLWAA